MVSTRFVFNKKSSRPFGGLPFKLSIGWDYSSFALVEVSFGFSCNCAQRLRVAIATYLFAVIVYTYEFERSVA